LKDIIITEKLDGGNACLKNGNVYARTHSVSTEHASFSQLKQINDFLINVKEHSDLSSLDIFGENMQAIHSIEYINLKSPFYIFNIKNNENNFWLSYKGIEMISKSLNLPLVPEVYRGSFDSIRDLQDFLDKEIEKESFLGGPREGFVVRPLESFSDDMFSTHVAKYVRKGHVQTDEHWSKNWKESKIDSQFWENFIKIKRFFMIKLFLFLISTIQLHAFLGIKPLNINEKKGINGNLGLSAKYSQENTDKKQVQILIYGPYVNELYI